MVVCNKDTYHVGAAAGWIPSTKMRSLVVYAFSQSCLRDQGPIYSVPMVLRPLDVALLPAGADAAVKARQKPAGAFLEECF